MSRRLSICALFVAWFCASGIMLDCVQVFAWARMFAGYARALPIEQAVAETMDPAKPCELCMAVHRARDAEKRQQPANAPSTANKLLLVFHALEPLVIPRPTASWCEAETAIPDSWHAPVPVPPPKAALVASVT